MARRKTLPAVLYEEFDGTYTLYFVENPNWVARDLPSKEMARQVASLHNYRIDMTVKRKK